MNAISFYRAANYCYRKNIVSGQYVIKYAIFLLFNSVIPSSCIIGKRSRFMYGGIGVVLHKNTIIGDDVAIGQGVTIGRKRKDGCPVIGNSVYIGAGARVLGDIRIGDNVIIGANSVVVESIPENSIVFGVPAKIIKKLDVGVYEYLGELL